MMAANPRNITDEARPICSAALMPSVPPRMTMAVLMNSSGRAASRSQAAKPGRKLAIARPASSAIR
jgi:hypothetical protein